MPDDMHGDLKSRNAKAFKWAVIVFAIVEALVIAFTIYLKMSHRV